MRGMMGALLALSTGLSLSACAGVVPSAGGGVRPPLAAPENPISPQGQAGSPQGQAGQAGRDADLAAAALTPSSPSILTPATPGTPLPAPNADATATTGATAGVIAGPAIASLGFDDAAAARALTAFRSSCPALMRRADTSGLTVAGEWSAACSAAATVSASGARAFFASQFRSVQVGDGRGFATGYYEPEIAGSRTRRTGFEHPVYATPADLVEIDLGLFNSALVGRRIRGRVDGDQFVPYHDRAAIDGGAIAGRGLEIAWVADPIEFFFLQVQGSGRLRFADGGVMRLAYANQNGREYVGIGRLLRDRGVLAPGESTMQGLGRYMRRQADGGRSILHANPSWVFFRELTGPGPIGSLNVPVVTRASVATDPNFVPLGAPVFLMMDRAEATGLWVAQDTGGAIRGSNRFDTFWGEGDRAALIAGGMASRGAVLVLLPVASVARLLARP